MRRVPGYRKAVTIAVAGGEIHEVAVGLDSLDPLAARSVFRDILCVCEGEFEFVPTPQRLTTSSLRWPIQQALLNSAALTDEITAHQKRFADPRTLFTATKVDIWLDDMTFDFWQRARQHLNGNAASAHDLAQALGLPLEEVQLYLYKLCLAGKLEPVRGYKVQQPAQRGIWQSVLDALRKRAR